jgi:hypothetical protein
MYRVSLPIVYTNHPVSPVGCPLYYKINTFFPTRCTFFIHHNVFVIEPPVREYTCVHYFKRMITLVALALVPLAPFIMSL